MIQDQVAEHIKPSAWTLIRNTVVFNHTYMYCKQNIAASNVESTDAHIIITKELSIVRVAYSFLKKSKLLQMMLEAAYIIH